MLALQHSYYKQNSKNINDTTWCGKQSQAEPSNGRQKQESNQGRWTQAYHIYGQLAFWIDKCTEYVLLGGKRSSTIDERIRTLFCMVRNDAVDELFLGLVFAMGMPVAVWISNKDNVLRGN